MNAPRVLEWVRDPAGVWNMPEETVAALASEFPDVRFDDPATREECDALLPQADVVLGYAVRPHNFSTAGRVRWVHSTAAGVGHMLFPELVESSIVVTNARGLHARSMAEHVLGVMLAFTRRLHVSRDMQNARRWTQAELWRGSPSFGELEGATLGIVGFGRIGQAVGAAARSFGMHVVAVRRRPQADPAPAHEQWGPGRLAGAALDVMETEPLPPGSPLWSMPEVIVTPHTSGVGPRFWERNREQFAGNLRRFLAGEPLENVVDKRSGY